MNCWHCNTKLIWGGDHDLEELEDSEYKDSEYIMETNLTCPECGSLTIVYYPKEKKCKE